MPPDSGRGTSVAFLAALVALLPSCGGLDGRNEERSSQSESASSQEAAALALWERFGVDPGEEPGRYESLAAMADGAHLIIEAVIDTVKPGRVFGEGEGAFRSTHLVLRARDVFKGNMAEGQTVTMGLGLAELDVDIASRYGDLAGDEGIFFLIPTWAPQPEFGIGDYPPEKGLDIYRPVNSQGVFIRNGSTVAVPLYLDDQDFPTQFRGMPFDEFEQRVDAAAAAGEGS